MCDSSDMNSKQITSIVYYFIKDSQSFDHIPLFTDDQRT